MVKEFLVDQYSKTPDEQHPILQNEKCCSRGGVAGQGISNVAFVLLSLEFWACQATSSARLHLWGTNSQNTSPNMACTPPHGGSCSFAEARAKQVRDWPLVCRSPSDWPKKAPVATPRKVLLIRGTLAILFTKMLLLVALEGCCSSGVDLYII